MTSEMSQVNRVAARGIVLSENYLLVAHCIGMEQAFVPGWHVEFPEGIRSSLSRGIRSELGLESEIKEYLGAIEEKYDPFPAQPQEISYLFKTEIPSINHLKKPESKEKHLDFYWIHVDDMEAHDLQPFSARTIIKNYCK